MTIDDTLNASNVVGNGSQLEGVATLNGTVASTVVGSTGSWEQSVYSGKTTCPAGTYVCAVTMTPYSGTQRVDLTCCT